MFRIAKKLFGHTLNTLLKADLASGIQRDEINRSKRLEGIASEVNIEAAVQIYVNKMAKKPEKWKYRADFEVLTSLQQLSPCE